MIMITENRNLNGSDIRIAFAYLDLYNSVVTAQNDPTEHANSRPHDMESSIELKFPAQKWALLHRLVAEEDVVRGFSS
jgi:hypothetical protein